MSAAMDPVVHARREGRLADPDRDLRSDPRTDPRLLAAFAAFGLDAPAAPPPFGRSAGQAAIAEFVGGADAANGSGLRGLHDRVAALDGELWLESPEGQGTRLRAKIPVV